MSENNNNAPSKLTTSVPLKWETLRVTLKSTETTNDGTKPIFDSTPARTFKPPMPPASPPIPEMQRPSSAVIPPSDKVNSFKIPAPVPAIPLHYATSPVAEAPTIKKIKDLLPGEPSKVAQPESFPMATVEPNAPANILSPAQTRATQELREVDTLDESFSKILIGVGFVAAIVIISLQLKIIRRNDRAFLEDR